MQERIERLNARSPECGAEILAVQLAAYGAEARLLGLRDFPPLHRTVQEVVDAAAEFFGVRREGQLVAVAEIELPEAGRAHIAGFVVHPDFFRQGLGSRLLGQVLETVSDLTVTVSTAVANAPAIGLYERFGFRSHEWSRTRDGLLLVTLRRESTR